MSVGPQPLTAAFFSERIEGMPPATSAAIFRALSGNGMLDKDGMLLKDPRCEFSNSKSSANHASPALHIPLEILRLCHVCPCIGEWLVADTPGTGRRSTTQRWQSLVREHVAAASELALEPDSSPLSEELNTAWASKRSSPPASHRQSICVSTAGRHAESSGVPRSGCQSVYQSQSCCLL